MKSNFLLAGSVLALIGGAVLYGFFSDGFGGRAASPTLTVGPAAGVMAAPAPGQAVMVPVAQTIDNPDNADTPPNYLPVDIQLSEAHWQGMDVRILDSELRRKLKYPQGLLGVLIDETTLNAAKAGFLAGDIIISVNQVRVINLEEFQRSSRMVRGLNKAPLAVLRKSGGKENGRYTMNRLTLVLRGDPDLGFAQVEAAPMILPGDGRPHTYRGACTSCHTVGVGFELTPDPDLITLPPPPLSHATVVKGVNPHRARGPCEACHVIKR
ncbi:MAG: magnetosome magnetite formation protein MamP [Rhodospirillales bacterium]